MTAPKLKIFHMPNTRSARVVWCAHEASIDVELVAVNLRNGDTKTPEYLAMHPLGKVPVALMDGAAIFESGAICHVLAEQSDDGFLPADPLARARCLSLAWFAGTELDRGTINAFIHTAFRPEGQRDEAMIAATRTLWTETVTPYLSGVLGDQTFLLGDRITLADIMVGYDCLYAGKLGLLDENLSAYVARLAERPGFQAAFAMG
jgi:glutathione S-transferase